MNTQKKELKNVFLGRMPELAPELSEAGKQRLCAELAHEANSYFIEINKEAATLLQDKIMELETTRNYLSGFINHLENHSKKIIEELKNDGMVWMENDKLGKNRMMARTKVVGQTVEYFNQINKLVKDYYQSIAPVPQPERVREDPETSQAAIIFRQGRLF